MLGGSGEQQVVVVVVVVVGMKVVVVVVVVQGAQRLACVQRWGTRGMVLGGLMGRLLWDCWMCRTGRERMWWCA
jgi:hypothetical protein